MVMTGYHITQHMIHEVSPNILVTFVLSTAHWILPESENSKIHN